MPDNPGGMAAPGRDGAGGQEEELRCWLCNRLLDRPHDLVCPLGGFVGAYVTESDCETTVEEGHEPGRHRTEASVSEMDKWTMEPSGDGKWITILGPEYGQLIEVHNDDVVEDQTPLAERIVRFLNEESP